jgi:hypothetical protein
MAAAPPAATRPVLLDLAGLTCPPLAAVLLLAIWAAGSPNVTSAVSSRLPAAV